MIERAMIFLVRLVSAAFRSLGWRACRFYPTCSEYSTGAFRHFSILKALVLSLFRFLRCHPFCRGGHDPLPGSTRPASRALLTMKVN